MIFFGLSKEKFDTNKVLDTSCPNCKAEGSLILYVFPRYFHLYWIPVFSVGKKARTVCLSCEKTFKGKKMPKSATIFVDDLKKQVKIPFWHFIGTFTFFVLVILLSGLLISTNKKQAAYFAQPIVGDIYLIKSDEGHTYWKLIGNNDDTLQFHTSGIFKEKYAEVNKEEDQKIYIGDTIQLSRHQVDVMYEEDFMRYVQRK